MDGKVNNKHFKKKLRYQNTLSGHTIVPAFYQCDGLYSLPIYGKDNKLKGAAYLTQTIKHAEDGDGYYELIVLVDICIYNEEDRKKGYASEIMEVAKNFFPKMITGPSTRRGRILMQKHGFVEKGRVLFYDRDQQEKKENKK